MDTNNERPYSDLGKRVSKFRKGGQSAAGANGATWPFNEFDRSQSAFAYWLGTAQGRVSRIERGYESATDTQANQLFEHAGIAAYHWDTIRKAELAAQRQKEGGE